jgi:acetyltransferase-like isoleucine patch superfamily enzyme
MISRKYIATSQNSFPVFVRKIRNLILNFSLPAPKIVVKYLLNIIVILRNLYYYFLRVFIYEPLNKAYCKQHGKNFHHDIYLHWVSGKGDIEVGDNVTFSGRLVFSFASRYTDKPIIKIGNNVHIGHGSSFTVGKSITIGSYCLISSEVVFLDYSGHPTDPLERRKGCPPNEKSVKPIIIGDNVWIGRRSIILPGVSIGNDSIIAAGAVVRDNVPPLSIMAGNPAKPVALLRCR